MKKNSKAVPTVVLVVYTVLFFLWWSVYELSSGYVFKEALIQDLFGSIIKLATWGIPAVFLIKKYEDSLAVPLSTMFTAKFKYKLYILLTLLLIGYILIGKWVEYGNIRLSHSFTPIDLIGKFLVVGITEEIVFRGWLLNAFIPKMGKAKAIAVSSFLFLCIHFPIWLKMGVFIQIFTSGTFLTVLILSVIFSFCFIKSKNIMVPVVIHMLWDLMLVLF